MKKVLLLFVFLGCIHSMDAQRKVKGNGNVMDRDRRVQPFTKVIVAGDFDVVFLNNPFDKKITVSGDTNLQALIETTVENGVLTIQYRQPVEIVSKTQDLKVTIPSRDITEIINKSSAHVYNVGAIEVLKFTLINEATGVTTFRLKTDEATIQQNGSGTIELAGSTNIAKFNLKGSGDVKASEMSTFYTEIESTGSANLYTNTVNGIDGFLDGSGNLYYRTTKTVNVTENSTGKIIKE